MKSKKPFYRHTSILLAVAFTAGIGIGSLSDSLNVQSSQDSILQRSPFVQSVTKKASLDSIGKVLAYEVYDGKVVDDKVGDDLNAPDVPKKIDITPVPVPKVEKPENQAPVFSYDISCEYTTVDKPVYKATALLKNQGVSSLPNGVMRVTIAYKNDGNTPWFSDSSGCANGPVIQLGTTHELDRNSVFANSDIGSGWAASNRIYMSSPRVDPGQTAMFTFDIKAPSVEDVYREMFGVVIPGVTWVKDSDFGLNVTVGQPYDEETAQKKLFFINGSGRGIDINLSAEKSVEVDLSEQKATLRLGDYVVRVFSVSTGAPDHPTPVGTWKILFKQQVRIGGAAPFYIMPKWQAIRPDGYGFHGLPSLGNATLRAKIRTLGPDDPVPTEWFKTDSFWTEALDHIGSARSHGCVRYLPDDADYVYDFTDVGTPVTIHK